MDDDSSLFYFRAIISNQDYIKQKFGLLLHSASDTKLIKFLMGELDSARDM